MTMRMTSKETHVFFDTIHLAYESKTITVGKHHLHYIETGNPDKPTLFFVHGSPGSWDAFKSYLTDSLLLSKYRMIAVDRPGFGYSDFGAAEDLDTQSDLLLKVIAQTDNKQPVTLVGHSLGGPLIVRMAVEKPQRFDRLVVLAGAVDPSAETQELWRRPLMFKPIRYLIPGALRPSNDELWWLKGDLQRMKPKLKNITSKVTIVHGNKDPLVPYSNVAFMKDAFVNAKMIDIVTIENANHFIPWEHFNEIRDMLYNLQ
jgi:pimeloyl-ACP methyl ester carboxylesterase